LFTINHLIAVLTYIKLQVKIIIEKEFTPAGHGVKKMAPLSDPVIFAKIRNALSNWRYIGYVTWKPIAKAWVDLNMDGMTTRFVAEMMFEHVVSGRVVDQVKETRSEWSEQQFHYDFRIPIGNRIIYIETILIEDDSEDPIIGVVSIHDV
jgi:hypothetical protein